MPLNRNTLMRIRTIDDCLSRRHRRWTLEDLRKACENALAEFEGIDSVSIRTTQRDIELMRSGKLGYVAPIVVKNRKYYEYADQNFSITNLPLSDNDIAELSSAIDIIKHYQDFRALDGAEDILARIQDKVDHNDSRSQILFLETNRQVKGLKFLNPLYEFISRKQPIVVDYLTFGSSEEKQFFLSPYVLKEFDNRWYLISYNRTFDIIQTLALDRMLKVNKDDSAPYIQNTFFDPKKYFAEMIGVTRNLSSRPVPVILKVDPFQAPYLLTKPIHPSQKLLSTDHDGSITIQLNLILNFELELRIKSLAEHIEVISPETLRYAIAKSLKKANSKYSSLNLNALNFLKRHD